MREKIGTLECLKRPGEQDGHNVVLLHGFGADNSDLFSLAELLDPDEQWNFYFPNAPLEVPVGPAWMGRGWFPISVRDLEVGVDFTQVRPPGMDDSAAAVYDLVFQLNSKTLVLGGFSQGAMIATEVAMSSPNDIAGLILYSGSLLDAPGWGKKASELKGKPVLMSHGMQDPVLPFTVGQRLGDLLKSSGAAVEFIPFMGGHEIPMPVLKKTKDFLTKF